MRVVAALALPLVISSLSFAPRAHACGVGLVSAEGSTVTQESQLSFVSVHATTTDVAVLLQLPSADSDFGALIPLPSSGEPTIDATPVDSQAFASLEQETRPQFISESDGGGGGDGCGCGSRALDGGVPDEFGSKVIAGDPVDVGPVTAQWLVANDAAALDGWLADNGFVAGAEDLDVLDTYIAEGNGFLAFKRNTSGVSAERTAIGVHFTVPGDLRAIALRGTTLGAPDVLPLTFVAFATPVGPDSPFEAIHFEDIDADAAIADYAGAVDDAIAAAGGKAWVFEGARSKDALSPTSLTGLVDAGAQVSRLSTRLAAADRDVDVIFSAPAPTATGTPASAAAMALPKHIDAAAVLLIAITLVMRRRRR